MHAPKHPAALAALVLVLAAAPAALAALGHPRPDDRVGIRGPVAVAPLAAVRSGRAGVRGAARAPTIVSVASGGFDWGSAVIGAGAGAGTILALLGAFLLICPNRVHTGSA